MAKIKSFDEFVNENLVLQGNYNYFGSGSLDPIIAQLLGEGKNVSIIRSYLTSLGVDPTRINNAMAKFEMELAIGEKKKVNESEEINERKLTKDKDKATAAQGGADVYIDGNDVDFVDAFPYKEWNKKEKDLDPTNANKYKAGSNDMVFAVSNIDNGDVTFYPGNALEVVESKKVKSTFEENATKFLNDINEEEEPKKATFEDVADMFVKKLNEEDKDKVEEKLNKETLQVEADGEDIDDMIDDLVDGDEDSYQEPEDDAPDDTPEDKIKDGESPADAVEDDNASPSDKLQSAAKELAKDSKKLDKIKKLLGEANDLIEAKEVELEDDGKEDTDSENIEVADNGDEIEIEDEVKEGLSSSNEKKVLKALQDYVKKHKPKDGEATEIANMLKTQTKLPFNDIHDYLLKLSDGDDTIIFEAKYNSSKDSDDIFFLWDDIIDDGRAGISHGQECIGLRCYSRFDLGDQKTSTKEKDLTKFEEEVKKLMKKKKVEI